MTMKIFTALLAASLLAGALAVAYFGNQMKFSALQNKSQTKPVKIRTAVHCKYFYDEMAHKLVAYSATEFSKNEGTNSFTYKLGSRILKFTGKGQPEQLLIVL